MKIYIETFGCTFNQADSEIMAGLLQEKSHQLVDKPEDAWLIIVNSCYVKQPTEQKVINRLINLQREFPQKKLIIGGCMVEIDQAKMEKIAPEAGWIGPHQIKKIPEVVKSFLDGNIPRLTGVESVCKVSLPKKRASKFTDIIQICEGCDGLCSYCCTRIARGNLHSYPLDLIKEEARKAVEEGCVELQLTAQDTASYGKDTGTSLSELINYVTSIGGDFRVRIGMMNPKSVLEDVDKLLKAFNSEKVYKFLHLPLQSGDNQVLLDMNRCHTVEEFKFIVSRFREEIPDISLATDIIVGYPTEDEQAFKNTLKTIKEVKPDFLHISKYHHRPGSLSSNLKEIEHTEMKKRSKVLNDQKTRIAIQKNEALLDNELKVLITAEGIKGGFTGRTNSYKTVVVDDAVLGSSIMVKITEAKATYLKGFPI
jgi:MiaB-like tRNA modifying enzyme